jgi:hypothetical protein
MESIVGEGRRLTSRQKVLALALVLAAGTFAYLRLRPDSPAGGTSSRTRARATGVAEVPAIGLARLDAPLAASAAGKRNLFDFGATVAPDDEEPEEEPEDLPPPPLVVPNPEVTTSPASRLVAINLKYIGTLEAEGGLRVAVLLTDRNEILYGQVGQQVANRFKILRIGHESVEVLDEGSGQSRRIPLKGN